MIATTILTLAVYLYCLINLDQEDLLRVNLALLLIIYWRQIQEQIQQARQVEQQGQQQRDGRN